MDLTSEEIDVPMMVGEIERTMSIGEDHETIADLYEIYQHDIQMYREPPTGRISLIEFDTLGRERLEVLRTIDRLSKDTGIKPAEFKECVLNVLKYKELDFYVKLITSPGCDSNTLADIEARRKDHTAHFILRLALCKKVRTLNWFLNLENKLLMIRFDSLSINGFEKFLALNNFRFPTLSEEEKVENRENLVAVHDNIDVDNTVFYKIPYLSLRKLVKERKTFIKRGIAFVPSTHMIHVISQSFKGHLNEESNRLRSAITKDMRLEPILKNFCRFTEKVLLYEPNSVPLDSLDELANTSFPLCMRTMHRALRREHFLKNGARFQYGLFLKLIGVSYDASVDFWKEEFLHNMDITTFEKQYVYHIKHVYGQVGRKVDYHSLGCNTLINSRVGFGEFHGCPYKNMTRDTLRTDLEKMGLEDDGIVEIEELANNGRYRESCSQCFHQKHKSAPAEMIMSPSHYTFCSQNLILQEKRLKQQKKNGKEEDIEESYILDSLKSPTPIQIIHDK